ncbi:MAG: peptide chain release factor-like protein [Chloroflexi bacterium]|nr:peptide chain release factor-like protein [Chloroflexota bacterium]MDA1239734.1 peptide chain release factor-like protein [Chloroflexota bacterium]
MTGWQAYLGLDDDALLAQCEVDRFRASGPGGQHRNKTDSAVRLRHRPTGLESVAVESRSQHDNRTSALRRLRVTIAAALRESIEIERYAPPPGLAGVIRGGRISVAQRNPRYPAVVAEVFDLVEACGWRLSDAAMLLSVSTTALGRFLEADPVLFRAANGRREALGMTPLRGRA